MQTELTEKLPNLKERTHQALLNRKVPEDILQEIMDFLETPEEFEAFLGWLETSNETNAEEMWCEAAWIAGPRIQACTRVLTPEEVSELDSLPTIEIPD